MTDPRDHDRRRSSPSTDSSLEDDQRRNVQDRRGSLRRRADMEVYDMAASALSMAEESVKMSTRVADALDKHVRECRDNYMDMKGVGKWIIGLLVMGTGSIIATLLYAIDRLFEFIVANPHLFANPPKMP